MFVHKYKEIIKIENLLLVWERFLRGKRNKRDVISFQTKLSDNLTDLHRLLSNRTYEHGTYSAFNVSDPKPRNIHKAKVRDRVLHHLINSLLPQISDFLENKVKLILHEHKVYVKTYASGVDFLGWTHFSHHRQIRATTKRKIIRKLKGHPKQQTIISYRGLLKHGDTYKLKRRLGLV